VTTAFEVYSIRSFDIRSEPPM